MDIQANLSDVSLNLLIAVARTNLPEMKRIVAKISTIVADNSDEADRIIIKESARALENTKARRCC